VFSPFFPEEKLRIIKKISAQFLRKKWKESYQITLPKNFGENGFILETICPKSDVTLFYPSNIFGKPTFYKKLSEKNPYYQKDKWEYQEALRWIPAGSKILEIGCGNGEFLSLCHKKGCQSVGLEMNRGIRNLDPETLRILNASWEKYLQQKKKSISVISAFQVLEHLPNPEIFFLRCAKSLMKGGMLILGVPNKESFIKHSFNLLDYPPHHMSRWSPKSFSVLARRYGFHVLTIAEEPLAPYHVDYFLDTQMGIMRAQKDWRRFIFKRPWRNWVRMILLLGIRKKIQGQSLLAVLRKTA
jgi:2-polyprenyl-3-methyl-5-hydroxy-6-metoxy-1,4-benzoquinol methylase